MACVNNIYFGGREEVHEPLEIEVKNVNEIKNKVIEINKNVKKLPNNVANKNEEEIEAIKELDQKNYGIKNKFGKK